MFWNTTDNVEIADVTKKLLFGVFFFFTKKLGQFTKATIFTKLKIINNFLSRNFTKKYSQIFAFCSNFDILCT
ncbi:hypothetical protein BKN14_05600 [Candidatus Gracilibacteria bacterium HOT-871]|nr:hypothetical protein BKN14_05600 [Candidatus Gracilibacteria bacterium HOT-871]